MKRLLHIAGLVALFLSSLCFSDPKLVTPTPKKMDLLGKRIAVEKGTIVITDTMGPLRVAAQEINHRLGKELGATRMVALQGNRVNVESADGVVVVIGVWGSKIMQDMEKLYPVDVPKTPEGYGISMHQMGRKTVVMLAGYDAQGALYAAVTLRYLFDPADDSKIPNGRAILHIGTVKDWPDFRWREIGKIPSTYNTHGWDCWRALRGDSLSKASLYGESHVQSICRYVDFLLRHKINLSEAHTKWFINEARMIRYARQINDYAHARGVHFVMGASTNIGEYPKDKDNPSITRCIDYRIHKRYFCYSLLDEHEKKIKHYATAMKQAGFHWLYLHALDGGGWENPALWNNRCEYCRKMYGDDHAKADAAIYNMYQKIIIDSIPNFQLIAVIYPYNGQSINWRHIEQSIVGSSGQIEGVRKLAKQIAKKHQKFLGRLTKLLEPSIKICQREVPRDSYDLMTKCYGKRDFQMYMEFEGNRTRWMPEFSMATGWAKTFYREGREDVFFPRRNQWGYNFMSEYMAAEFGWNKEAPGSGEYPGGAIRMLGVDHHNKPKQEATAYLNRFCRDFWGPEVGPYMVKLYDSNISWRFIQKPSVVAQAMNMKEDEVPRRIQEMIKATTRAFLSMEKARAVYDAAKAKGRLPILNRDAHRYFGDFYMGALAAQTISDFRLHMIKARAAVMSGDLDEANKRVKAMKDAIKKGKTAWAKRQDWIDSIPRHQGLNSHYVFTFGQFIDYDFGRLEQELAVFEKERHELFTAFNVPSWFKDTLRSRELMALVCEFKVKVDGKLDEAIWQDAPKNEYLVNYKNSVLAEKETDARLLYDDEALYVGFTCFEPRADTIPDKSFDREEIDRNNSVELFVDANKDQESYVQFMWDIAGNQYDSKKGRRKDGLLRDNRGYSTKAEVATTKFKDRWIFEAKVPFDDLGGVPKVGDTWRGNLCRNFVDSKGQRQSVSTILLDGKGFHTPERFATIRFLEKAPLKVKPVPTFATIKRRAGQITIGTGVGFEAVFDAKVETNRPLHQAMLTAKVFCGDKPRGEVAVFENQTVMLSWFSRSPIQFLSKTPDPKLEFHFILKAKEGEWKFVKVFGKD